MSHLLGYNELSTYSIIDDDPRYNESKNISLTSKNLIQIAKIFT